MLMLGLVLLLDSLAVQVGSVTVVAEPRHRALAIALAEQADQPVTWPGLGRVSPPPFTLVLAEDSAQMARVTRGRAPAWGAGVAFPQARLIVLRADLPDLRQTLRHELAHLVLRSSGRVRVPLWFDEGYASWATGELGAGEVLELNLAVATGRIPGLQEVDRMLRASARTADLAYALAASAVGEIARRPEPGGLGRMLERLRNGEPFDSALAASTGLSMDRFEEQWHRTMKRRYGLITWGVAGGLWLILACAVALLWWVRRERDRPRRVALDHGWVISEEPPENPPAIDVPHHEPAPGPVDPRTL
jgi:hypothetical protein